MFGLCNIGRILSFYLDFVSAMGIMIQSKYRNSLLEETLNQSQGETHTYADDYKNWKHIYHR